VVILVKSILFLLFWFVFGSFFYELIAYPMKNLKKNLAALLNVAFAPYFWQPKCEVGVVNDPDGSIVVAISQGSKNGVFYFPSSYAYNPGVLAEEVLKAWALKKFEAELRGFQKFVSRVEGAGGRNLNYLFD
jgi:hypothetical protein